MISDNNKNRGLEDDKGALLAIDSDSELFLGRDNSISIDNIQEYIANISD
jgi:hypothetical protein